MSSICRVAGPVSFFAELATFQIAPSGAWTTPPQPQSYFEAGFSGVAPASSAAPTMALTSAG